MAEAVNTMVTDDLHVDVHSIEKQLAGLWRAEKDEQHRAVTKAALWNVVAHTWTSAQHAHATEVLSRASASVPQRSIVIQADPDASSSIASWISANCHLIAGDRQICSEEVAIMAGGDRVERVPPLVSSLLLPDMPVAVWWIGELPRHHHRYAELLLEPADRLIYDSAHFEGRDDLEFVARIAEETTTAPADLNWARIEEWRAATATLFDPASMRERLLQIGEVRITSGGGEDFGQRSEALLFVAWLIAQTGRRVRYELAAEGNEEGIAGIEIRFEDGATAVMRGDSERRVVVANPGSVASPLDSVTRSLTCNAEDLIVRMLKRPEADRVYLKALRVMRELTS